ncbi:hypothetical protein J5J83_03065 [Azoarcus sp. L1K30]|nr:hypothetical protein [Azoarcus sp. L1K30]
MSIRWRLNTPRRPQPGVGTAHGLNLIRLDTSLKASIRTKRLPAGASDELRAVLVDFERPEEGDEDEDDE